MPFDGTTLNLDERPVLDFDYTAFQTIAPGNIRVTGMWMIHPDTKRSQPCLVLTNAAHPLKAGRCLPFIIPLSEAWRWTLEYGDPEDNKWPVLRGLLHEGGLPGNPYNNHDVWQIFDAIQSRLRDMMAMEPMPAVAALRHRAAPEVIGELIITDADTGKVLHETEITANVRC